MPSSTFASVQIRGKDDRQKNLKGNIEANCTHAHEKSFDIGSDAGTGVNDADYQAPFAFDGTLNTLTLKLLPPG